MTSTETTPPPHVDDRAARSTLSATLDDLLRSAVDRGDVPGVSLAVATRDAVLYSGAAGVRRLGEPASTTDDTVVWLASQTKVLTVVAALQLVEQGLIELDDPVYRWVPAIADVPVLDGYDADGAPRTRPATTPVTLRHLITHTAGGGYPFFNADVRDVQQRRGVPGILSGRLASLADTPWLHEPGTAFEYGTNIDWLGLVVEKVAGIDLAEVLRARIIEPLGLRDVTAVLDDDLRRRLASVHARGEDGTLSPIDFALPEDAEFGAGGHFLYGTVVDYVRLLQALLRGGELDGVRILREDTVHAGLSNQLGTLRFTPIRTADPATTRDVDPFPGVPGTWGWFGLINLAPTATGRSAGSSFWAGLANTYWWLDPGRGVVGAIATQILPFADPAVLGLQAEVERAVGDWLESGPAR